MNTETRRSFAVFSTLLIMACSPVLMTVEIRQDLLGDSAQADAATRLITITPSTRYVHVEGGEVVAFAVDDKTFAWNFNGPLSVASFDLQRVAPAGALRREVRVIIAPNPRYMGP